MGTEQSGRRPKFDPDQPQQQQPQQQREAKTTTEAQDEHRAFNTIVGEAIRRSRQEHGWTQAFLAEQAGLSPNYVARLERGELGPSLFVASRICDALGMEIDLLVVPAGQTGRKVTGTKRRALTG